MWVFLSDAFLSIVAAEDHGYWLLVRARKDGDIQAAFPHQNIVVKHTPNHDYAYRAFIARDAVADRLAKEARELTYTNFKNSVRDRKRHDAYLGVWQTMVQWQTPPTKRKRSRQPA